MPCSDAYFAYGFCGRKRLPPQNKGFSAASFNLFQISCLLNFLREEMGRMWYKRGDRNGRFPFAGLIGWMVFQQMRRSEDFDIQGKRTTWVFEELF
jgi:hypothetical protein